MNMSAECDVDPSPDIIAGRLAGASMHAWIFDHPGRSVRNAILACRPERSFKECDLLAMAVTAEDEPWACRRARRRRPLAQRDCSSRSQANDVSR